MQRHTHLGLAVLTTSLALAAACGIDPRLAEEGGPGSARRSQALVASEVLPTGGTCSPTGAHGKHAAANIGCTVCHACGGVLQFDPAGPAVAPGLPAPSFDATAKTCSNVACHGVPAGTFSYYFPGGDGEPALNTFAYGGTFAQPYWYAEAGGTCAACHANPPRNAVWHSGYHGGQGPAGANNQCQLCHPDATGSGGAATGLVPANAALHRNGAVNVQANFKSTCFGCH